MSKEKKKKKKKEPGDIIILHMCTKIMITWCTVPEVLCAAYGQTDKQKKRHIEVGALPKNR